MLLPFGECKKEENDSPPKTYGHWPFESRQSEMELEMGMKMGKAGRTGREFGIAIGIGRKIGT